MKTSSVSGMKRHQKWAGRWAQRVEYTGPTTQMSGNSSDAKLIIHNEGVDRNGKGDYKALARFVNEQSISYHMVWDARYGKFAQMLPFDKAARSLENGGINNNVGCNRSGLVCIQICVLGYGYKPFTDGPMVGAYRIRQIAAAWGIPLKKIGGHSPVSFQEPTRAVEDWNTSGFGGHSHAPRNSHVDPGPISWTKFLAALNDTP